VLRPRPIATPAFARRSPGARAAAAASPDPATLPNLVASPAWQIRVRHARGRDLVTFAATIWNAGPAPFSIEGFRRPDGDLMDAVEYFSDAAGHVVGRAPAGTLFFDHGHGHHHWHLRQLAAYSLLGASGRVVRSHKQSFCIAPTNAVDLTVPGALRTDGFFGGIGLGFGGSVCDLESPHAIWLREQLPAGWGDTYVQSVAGQALDVTRVPNGDYGIEVRANPLGLLQETSSADDVAVRRIRLSGRPGARRASVQPWNGIRG
jgi:hypothetical protein